jgi:very-short-patch-repair endonuclease
MKFEKGNKLGKRFEKGYTPHNKGVKGVYHHPQEFKDKLSEERKGKHINPKNEFKKGHISLIREGTIEKIRISTFEYAKRTNNIICPRQGKYEKQILNELQNIIGFSIKRQFYVNGYWLDGYCQELNLAIEIDEEFHYKRDKQKDLDRQFNIMKSLNCNFLRLRVKEIISKNEVDVQRLNMIINNTGG